MSSRREMDVSYTNMLEGVRQYFQGLPAPSTADSTNSTQSGVTTVTAYSHQGAVTTTTTTTTTAAAGSVAGPHPESGAGSRPLDNNGYWNPVDPNEPRPVLETCPPAPIRYLEERGRGQKESSNCSSSSSSPAPVYQQLYPSTQGLPNDQAHVQRPQYYPRYHHPDIAKSALAPFSQNSGQSNSQQQGYHHSSNPGYPPRRAPQEYQQPPPGGSYNSPSPGFQPHSPTYPPPSPRSSYHPILSPTSQQQPYQASYATNSYPQSSTSSSSASSSSSRHSFQKGQAGYYPQIPRSQASYHPTVVTCSTHTSTSNTPCAADYQPPVIHVAQQPKHANYNGAPAYGSYRPQQQQERNSHNLPPIAGLSSYHGSRNNGSR